jgi:hypothetical protein
MQPLDTTTGSEVGGSGSGSGSGSGRSSGSGGANGQAYVELNGFCKKL